MESRNVGIAARLARLGSRVAKIITRHPAGSSKGGQFAPKGTGGGGGAAAPRSGGEGKEAPEVKSRNKEWGFHGTIASNAGGGERGEAAAAKAFTQAANDLVKAGHFGTTNAARDFLDSKAGRHLADAVGKPEGKVTEVKWLKSEVTRFKAAYKPEAFEPTGPRAAEAPLPRKETVTGTKVFAIGSSRPPRSGSVKIERTPDGDPLFVTHAGTEYGRTGKTGTAFGSGSAPKGTKMFEMRSHGPKGDQDLRVWVDRSGKYLDLD